MSQQSAWLSPEEVAQVEKIRCELSFPVSSEEIERLDVLRGLRVLDSPEENSFDRITAIASRMFEVPIALVSLVDLNRQWFKSKTGLDAKQTPRDVAFCNYVVMPSSPDVFVVLDSHEDDRFKNNALVTGPPYVRFYAGAALIIKGQKVGTLCLVDRKPRERFDIREKGNLLDLAGLVVDELLLREQTRARMTEDKHHYITCTAHDLKTPVASFRLAVEMLRETTLSQRQRELVDHLTLSTEMMSVTLSKALVRLGANGDDRGERANVAVQERVSLRMLVRRVRALIDMHPKTVPLRFVVAPDLASHVMTDGTLVWQSMVNLLTNALSHTTQGAVECKLMPPLTAARGGGLRVEVWDTGTGVAAEVVSRLFMPFTQLSSAQSGAGLGLYAVRTAIRMLRGSYGGGDRQDGVRGAMFWFEVPPMLGDASSAKMSDEWRVEVGAGVQQSCVPGPGACARRVDSTSRFAGTPTEEAGPWDPEHDSPCTGSCLDGAFEDDAEGEGEGEGEAEGEGGARGEYTHLGDDGLQARPVDDADARQSLHSSSVGHVDATADLAVSSVTGRSDTSGAHASPSSISSAASASEAASLATVLTRSAAGDRSSSSGGGVGVGAASPESAQRQGRIVQSTGRAGAGVHIERSDSDRESGSSGGHGSSGHSSHELGRGGSASSSQPGRRPAASSLSHQAQAHTPGSNGRQHASVPLHTIPTSASTPPTKAPLTTPALPGHTSVGASTDSLSSLSHAGSSERSSITSPRNTVPYEHGEERPSSRLRERLDQARAADLAAGAVLLEGSMTVPLQRESPSSIEQGNPLRRTRGGTGGDVPAGIHEVDTVSDTELSGPASQHRDHTHTHEHAPPRPVVKPVPPVTKSPAPARTTSASSAASAPVSKSTALVVDDSPIVRRMVVRALRSQGCVVSEAEHGRAGLELMQRHHYDVVYMDFLMPIMNGIECVRLYREWERAHGRVRPPPHTTTHGGGGDSSDHGAASAPEAAGSGVGAGGGGGGSGSSGGGGGGGELNHTQSERKLSDPLPSWPVTLPIIGMSANAEGDDVRAGMEAGMTEFHPKPVSLQQLRDMLAAAVARREGSVGRVRIDTGTGGGGAEGTVTTGTGSVAGGADGSKSGTAGTGTDIGAGGGADGDSAGAH